MTEANHNCPTCGRKIPRKRGKPKGTIQASKLDAYRKDIERCLDKGSSVMSISKALGCGRSTLVSYIKNRRMGKSS